MTITENQPKIFGIGLNKTGTTTLGECGKILGFRCKSCDGRLLKDVVRRNDFSRIKQTVHQYDFFEDWPWPLIYKKLDRMFPGSKFILTVRKNEQKWLQSLKKHAMRTHPIMHSRKLTYGYYFPHKHEQEHLEFYRQHNDSVRSYFAHRQDDFLELCWENGDGFEKLAPFLNCDVPTVPVPHANRGADNPVKLHRFWLNRLLCGWI